MQYICKILTGSHLYGISNENSDKDYKGIFHPTKDELFGLYERERMEENNGLEGKDKEEGVYYSLKRFCQLCIKSNPTIIELAFANKKFYEVTTPIGEEVMDYVRNNGVTKKLFSAFYGYAQDQIKMITTGKARRKQKRNSVVEEFGYDTKAACHAYRLTLQGIEFLTRGMCNPTLEGSEKDYALRVRTGDVSLEDISETLSNGLILMKKSFENSTLPEQVDEKAFNDFLIQTHCKIFSIELGGVK